jgi:hypothetical protein
VLFRPFLSLHSAKKDTLDSDHPLGHTSHQEAVYPCDLVYGFNQFFDISCFKIRDKTPRNPVSSRLLGYSENPIYMFIF